MIFIVKVYDCLYVDILSVNYFDIFNVNFRCINVLVNIKIL